MKKRIGTLFMAFTLALTGIVSFAEEPFTEAVAEPVLSEEIQETEPETDETVLSEEIQTEENILSEESDSETMMEETTVPENIEEIPEEIPAAFDTEKSEDEIKTETESRDGYFDISNPEYGDIMTEETAGDLDGTVTAQVPEGDSVYEETEYEVYLNIDLSALPDNEELIAGYIDQLFDLSGIATIANHGEKYLNGDELAIYEILRAAIEDIAAGNSSSAKIYLSGVSFTWTYDELGLNASADGDTIGAAVSSKFTEMISMGDILSYLLVDCPYDLYWFDKTVGITTSFGLSYSRGNYVTMSGLNVIFAVASGYQAAGYDDSNPAVDTEKTSVPAKAAANAKAIAEKYASLNSVEKMTAYKDEICALVSYNYEAADESYTGGYGDPWQLVYVFDGDDSTNVVCEGYSKAFQYLCDLDGGDELCYLVSGTMKGGTGEGAHMWNVVRLDGTNYLVDVTNSDTGTVGRNGELFLVTGSDAVSSDYPTYIFKTASGTEITYTYGSDTLSMFPKSVLELTTEAPVDLSYYDIILSEEEYTYDGTEKEPVVTVIHEAATLVQDEDYRVSYSGNINAGTATVTITGIGDYKGEEEAEFTINPADIASAGLTLSQNLYTYDGTEHKPAVAVTYGSIVLVEGADYTVEYNDNINAGTAAVTVSGKGNYKGTLSSEFTIDKAEQTITVEPASDTIAYGETTVIIAEAGFTDEFTYVSLDSSVAEVNENGEVTAVGTGKADVMVTAAETDNYKSASTTVSITVIKAKQTVTAELASDMIAYLDTTTITAVSTGTDKFEYSSDNPDIAIVDGEGVVTAVGIGTAVITVTAEADDFYESDSTTVSITVGRADQTVTAQPESSRIAFGEITKITAATSGTGTITYKSSDLSVATVNDDGTVTALKPGTAVITVTAEENEYYKTASTDVEITVTKADQSLTVSIESDEITFGETTNITADRSGTGNIIYSSSDVSVATVSEEGIVTGVMPGSVIITVTAEEDENYEAAIGTISLTVKKAEQTVTAEAESDTVVYGDTTKITADGIGIISYETDDDSVAIVDENGWITAAGTGEAVITVTASGNEYYGEGSKTFIITVIPKDFGASECSLILAEESYIYDGSAKAPEVILKVEDVILAEGTDYEVEYDDNVNAGEATVIVTGKGNYSGELTEKFTIEKGAQDISYDLTALTKPVNAHAFTNMLTETLVSADPGNGITYTGSNPSIADVDAATGEVFIKGTGTVIITATAAETANYTSAGASYELNVITPEAAITADVGDHSYDGEAIHLYAGVTHDPDGDADELTYSYQWYRNSSLIEGETGEILTLTGDDVAVQEGTVYTCVITISSEYFTDTVEAGFTVNISQADNSLTILFDDQDKIYDGTAVKEPEVIADFGGDTVEYTWYKLDENGEVAGKLEAAPSEPGTYKVTAAIAETNNYAGAYAEMVFTIEPQTVTDNQANGGSESGSLNGTDQGDTSASENESETAGDTEKESASEEESPVATGDMTPVNSWSILFAAAGICLLLLFRYRRVHGREM